MYIATVIELDEVEIETLTEIANTYDRWEEEGVSYEDHADVMYTFLGDLLRMMCVPVAQSRHAMTDKADE